jgi:hypothetical protein
LLTNTRIDDGNPRAAARPFVGVLMLDTRFPRLPGDIGHPQTFARAGIAVRFRVVRGATPERVVIDADASLLDPFVAAARDLVAQGAELLTTSCGFLAAHQRELQGAVDVPVIASSLLLCRRLARPGIVTIDADALTPALLLAAGVKKGTPVQAVDASSAWRRGILGNHDDLEHAEGEAAVVRAARELVARHPQVEDIVLECTNMPPHRAAVASATQRRVHDIESAVIDAWRSFHGS